MILSFLDEVSYRCDYKAGKVQANVVVVTNNIADKTDNAVSVII